PSSKRARSARQAARGLTRSQKAESGRGRLGRFCGRRAGPACDRVLIPAAAAPASSGRAASHRFAARRPQGPGGLIAADQKTPSSTSPPCPATANKEMRWPCAVSRGYKLGLTGGWVAARLRDSAFVAGGLLRAFQFPALSCM